MLKAAPGQPGIETGDWPYIRSRRVGKKPNDALLFDLLAQWAPDESVRNRILVENPAKLYGFSAMQVQRPLCDDLPLTRRQWPLSIAAR